MPALFAPNFYARLILGGVAPRSLGPRSCGSAMALPAMAP